MSWWVGAYIEAGMGAGGNSDTPYLPFVFQAPDKQTATAHAGAKLLAGPFGTQQGAQNWANAYEKDPNTLHAGNDLNKKHSVVKGDKPPAAVSGLLTGLNAVGDFFSRLTEANTWLRVAEFFLGLGLIIVGVARMAGDTPVGRAATTVGTFAKIL